MTNIYSKPIYFQQFDMNTFSVCLYAYLNATKLDIYIGNFNKRQVNFEDKLCGMWIP